MTKTIVDMYAKGPGSYRRLLDIAKSDFPDMKPVRTWTVMFEMLPVLLLTFTTGE